MPPVEKGSQMTSRERRAHSPFRKSTSGNGYDCCMRPARELSGPGSVRAPEEHAYLVLYSLPRAWESGRCRE